MEKQKMNQKLLGMVVGIGVAVASTSVGYAANSDVARIKSQIVDLAKSYEGKPDPDFSKQRALNVLVGELLRAAPQPPVADRVRLIQGVWRQVWGPYDYRSDNRGIDPELGTEEIYQVVFEGGYYYNASYLYHDGDRRRERIGLLRGEYKVDPNNTGLLRVKFTRYPGASSRISGKELWELPELAEAGQLENEISIVPTWIVRLFFGGGALREVYTDSDLRITYGSDGKHFDREYIYIMSRVQ
jgi:hypothetical protein